MQNFENHSNSKNTAIHHLTEAHCKWTLSDQPHLLRACSGFLAGQAALPDKADFKKGCLANFKFLKLELEAWTTSSQIYRTEVPHINYVSYSIL